MDRFYVQASPTYRPLFPSVEAAEAWKAKNAEMLEAEAAKWREAHPHAAEEGVSCPVGQVVEFATPERALAEMTQVVSNIIQNRLDDFARSWGYDNIYTACTYIGSLVPVFDAEGRALRNWRDMTWAAARQAAGQVASIEAMLAILPPFPTRPQA